MPKLKINNTEIEVAAGTSILQAAEQLGIEIPRFCYHDRLSVPANCRMCLVEVKGGPPKPAASCAMACADNMEVFTDSEMVHKARRGVMEFLLINHPLDCPICDQGGECDLQDQAVGYGFDRSRYFESKRAVKDKELGPLVKTVMTRCIQCTRCIRFASEIAGVDDLGLLNRGEDVEVGTFVEKACASELSGNLVDICPVGALTNKPAAFSGRAWEMRKTESIDVMDAVGSNIRIDARGNEVMRILPRLHEDVNEEWIADKSRYIVDGLKRQRLDRPYVRDHATGRLVQANWDVALARVAEAMQAVQGYQMAAIAGDLVDVESTMALRDLMHAMGSNMLECRVDGAQFDVAAPAGYRFNTTIAGIEKADALLLVGTNPRWDAAIINARIRKAWLNTSLPVGLIGAMPTLNYPCAHIGTGPDALDALMDGTHDFAKTLQAARNPMVILGTGALQRVDGMAVQAKVRALATHFRMVRDDWQGYNMLHLAAGRMGSLMLGFTPPQGAFDLIRAKFVYLLGVDTPMVQTIPADAFVVYQGHHGDVGAARADVVLPGCAYTEKNALYVNTEGRVQSARQAVSAPGEAKEDWKILRALSGVLDKPLSYNTHSELRLRLGSQHPAFADIDQITPAAWTDFGKAGPVMQADFGVAVANYYQTDPITRASETMAACTERFVAPLTKGTAKAA